MAFTAHLQIGALPSYSTGVIWPGIGVLRGTSRPRRNGGSVSDVRGNPWEHDPGPPGSSGWAELFAGTPNYRGLGQAVVGREAFRWHHGPMFFRGRLDGSAKVLVVGQEGAQDESLSHRSFTGGTGARMQYLLHFLGFDRSYLFLNSFVYPIFGQYTPDLRPLAQDPRSPIVIHRNQIFDKAVIEGDVRLVIAVGRAAKESVATWIEAHGGTAQPESSAHGVARIAAEPGPGGGGAAPRQRGVGVDGRDQGRLRARDRARQGLAPGRPRLASGRPRRHPGSRGAVSVLLAGDPVPGLPVRHLPASGPRRDVEQPQR